MMLLVAVPVGVGIGLVARPLVWLFLGPAWLETVRLIQVLAVFGVLRVGYANVGPVFLALGRTRTEPVLTVIHLAALVPLLFATVPVCGAWSARRGRWSPPPPSGWCCTTPWRCASSPCTRRG
jgi:O-antigen/teichoic acid export membrane protein